jgi:hypothetical protein
MKYCPTHTEKSWVQAEKHFMRSINVLPCVLNILVNRENVFLNRENVFLYREKLFLYRITLAVVMKTSSGLGPQDAPRHKTHPARGSIAAPPPPAYPMDGVSTRGNAVDWLKQLLSAQWIARLPLGPKPCAASQH